MTYFTNTLPRPNLKLPPMDAAPTPQPAITWAEMAALERKRHGKQWSLGNAGATPLSANALNERRMDRSANARLTITAFLSSNPGAKRGDIARGLGVNPNTLQAQLQRLHSTGVINRDASNKYTNVVTV